MKERKTIFSFIVILTIIVFLSFGCKQKSTSVSSAEEYSGSKSCIECHERFYDLWSGSFHGKAMQPVNAGFMKRENVPPSKEISMEGKIYNVEWKDSSMVLFEKSGGGVKEYEVNWSLGGKNVYCFLTPLEKGRLQTIPLAYDVNRKKWFNYPQSAVRHFVEDIDDEPLPWKDRMYTFNTACYNCHVSQLNTNYDLASGTYHTTWREAGINCETCHGPSNEHVKVCREAKEGEIPEDLKIISTSIFTPEQHNSSCAPCHAKMQPISKSYIPGEPYFDNYNLSTFEDHDFYPDGRDLGENYTLTGWQMNECMIEGDLHCVSCHTSSGRTRFTGDQSNQLCMPCHQENVQNVVAHSGHSENSEGSKCVNCHLPKREFVGHFIRSDHSFRPPMPEATIKFGSPNACNDCHQDKSAEWANNIVKNRKNSKYQEGTLYWGQLLKEAREGNWQNLDEILEVIKNDSYGEVVTNSFVRILAGCENEKKWDVLYGALKNKSPLVRSSVAASLSGNFSEEAKNVLITAAGDDFKLVRINAALTLSAFPDDIFNTQEKELLAHASEEYKESLIARPDDWSAHYNMGIYYQNRGDISNAISAYETSSGLYSKAILPLINSSVLYSYIGDQQKAEENLRKAVQVEPENEAANLNLGLLLAEVGNKTEAISVLLKVLEINPKQAVAAYNLCVLLADENINESIRYAKMAVNSAPENTRYAYTLAFYQNQNGKTNDAISTLKENIKKQPVDINSVFLLGEVYLKQDKKDQALKLYERVLTEGKLQEQDKSRIQQIISQLENS